MFGKRFWAAAVLAAALVMGSVCTAIAAEEAEIINVSLKIMSHIRAGSEHGNVEVTTSNSRYHVEDFDITNEPEDGWKDDSRPRIRITLEAEEGYYFKSVFSKDDVSLSGADATVFSVSRNSDTRLVITVTLGSVDGNSGGYDLVVYDLQWEGDSGYARWGEGRDAKRYEVKVYCGDSLLNSVTLNTTSASYNFTDYVTEAGEYTFQVRGVYNSSYKGDWVASGVWNVDAGILSQIKESIDNLQAVGTDKNPDDPSVHSPEGPAGSAGAWLFDGLGWWYCNADKSYTINDWQEINGRWYYFDSHGHRVTGWVFWNNVYYYCGLDGSMLTDAWTPDGSYVDGNGAWVEGMSRQEE